jgi:UTP--glucose-1-phosphate uridylyltransferase
MIKKCLFPAAGYGTRFLPATKAIPKEMLPILNKPLLQYGVEEALQANITNMAIVTGRGKRAIEDHFDNSFELEAQLKGTPNEHYLNEINSLIERSKFTYVRQHQMLGLGHAILSGFPLIGNEPFAVVLSDDLCYSGDEGVLSQMVKVFDKYKCSIIAVEEVAPMNISKYGAISGDLISDDEYELYDVTDMVEKPKSTDAPSNMAIIGRYILTPDIFNALKQIEPGFGGELQITDAILTLAKENRVIALNFTGKRFDCGDPEGYLEALIFYANKMGINK